MKTKEIGSISFTEEGYDLFIKKTKQEQIEEVYNNLSPKDYEKAEKLLTHIPHGDISSSVQPKTEQDNTADVTGGSDKNSTKRRRPGTEESKD